MSRLKVGQLKELERLGLAPDATLDDIKNKRRELNNEENYRKARKFSFSDLKNGFSKAKEAASEMLFGDEQETEKPSGLLENIDAYTGAPARAAISTLQDDATNVAGAAESAYKQFGASPKTAPSGQDLAAKMGLEGLPKAAAGLGLELAADPSAAVSGLVKAASLPLIGVKYMDKIFDSAKVATEAEKLYDMSRALKAPRVNAVGQVISGPSAVNQIKSVEALEKAKKLEKHAEMLLKREGDARFLEALNEISPMPKISPEAMAAHQKELAEYAAEHARIEAAQKAAELAKRQPKPAVPGGVVDEVPAESITKAIKMSGESNIPTPHGKIITAPSKFEKLQEQLKAAKQNKK